MAIWNRRPGHLPAPPPPARPPADPGPDFLGAPPTLRALLREESEVSGKLSFSGPTRIDGTLRGEVRATDLLVIGETGYVHGTVRGATVVILGRVDGDVVGAERVEIGPRGTLLGSVEARALVVHEGARLDGDCRVAPTRATVHVLRPRSEADTAST